MLNLRKAMSAIMCFVIMSTMFISKSPLHAETISVTPGSSVTLQFRNTVSSKAVRVGSQINLSVLDGIYIGDKMVVAPGAEAIGTVRYSKPNGIIGSAGSITIEAVSVRAVDGTQIPVHGSVSIQGKSNATLAIIVGLLLCPLACFIHGEDAKVLSGTTITARVTGMQRVNVQP